MIRALVVYDSWYDNTKAAAQEIAKGLAIEDDLEAIVHHVDALNPAELPNAQILVLGSPNHMGGPTAKILRLIRRLHDPAFSGKAVACFDTCFDGQQNRVTRTMETRLEEGNNGLHVLTPGLSVVVEQLRGPLRSGELRRCREFGERIRRTMRKELSPSLDVPGVAR